MRVTILPGRASRTVDPRRGSEHRLPIRICLLGPVAATRDGAPVDLGPPRRRAVLAVLAVHAGRAVPLPGLIGALWGDRPPASAAGAVYTHVSALRRALDPGRRSYAADGVLTSSGDGYELRVPGAEVDVTEFLARRDEAARARSAGDVPGERRALRAALDLWTGPALDGVSGPFAEAQRQRLDELRRTAADRLAALRHTPFPTAPLTTAPLTTAPLTTAPLTTAPVSVPSARPEPTAGRDRFTGWEPIAGRETFAGREAELAVVRRAAAALAGGPGGPGGSLWIDGEPGIGKSALVRAGLTALPRPARVGWGAGNELLIDVPLAALLECLDVAPGPAYDDLARSASTGTPGEPTPDVLDRAATLVEQRCAAGPLVLVLDDIHWADDTTLLAWHRLHRLTRRLPLLLIAAGRPAPGRTRLTLLRDTLTGTPTLTLPPLSRTEGAALLAVLGAGDGAAELAPLAAGNPGLLRALAAAALHGELTGPGDAGTAPAVRQAVDAVLDTLPEPGRAVLSAVAALGGAGPADALATALRQPAPALAGVLTDLLATGMLTATDDGVALRHPLVRRVLDASLPPAIRVVLTGMLDSSGTDLIDIQRRRPLWTENRHL
jgi:DNA-binding winged helix-turn-helix (wHTH) protein